MNFAATSRQGKCPLTVAFLSSTLLVGGPVSCGSNAFDRIPSDGDAAYSVADWPKLPPDMKLGQVAGVAVDSQDRVYVFHRAGADFGNETVIDQPTMAVIDSDSGELVDEWGAGLFIVPHGLAIDVRNHVWASDVGNNTVTELTRDGEVLRQLHGYE